MSLYQGFETCANFENDAGETIGLGMVRTWLYISIGFSFSCMQLRGLNLCLALFDEIQVVI